MAHRTVEQLGHEIENFQDDIRKLQRELGEMLKSAAPGKKTSANPHRLSSFVQGCTSKTGKKAQAVYRAVCQGGYGAVDKGRMSIEKKPVTSVLIAFAAGLTLSHLFGRIRS